MYMKLRTTPYVPKKRKRTILKFLTLFICLCTGAMWLMRDILNIDVPTLCIFTGLALMAVSMAILNRKKENDIKVEDSHIEKLRENMGKDNFNDTSVFFN